MKTYNLFISHSWTYKAFYDNLIRLLDEKPYFKYRNYSVPRDNPIHGTTSDTALRGAIKNQMHPCGVVIILAGVYATYSKWINIEIELARSGFVHSKPIIAIEHLGSEKTSQPVKNAASKIVKWNTDSIVRAIREL